ncbi:MAG: macro domain-containing protein, partial [Atopobiaceae bacterium]|nr:macro domain-containing protein [Atopobiaceae bacterium]
GGMYGEQDLLASCYRSSLNLACELGDSSIAFPLISSGIYGYPPAEALAVAVGEIRAFLEDHPDFEVTLCLFDRRATTLTQDLYGAIEQYVDDTYVEDSPYARRESWEDTLSNAYPVFGGSMEAPMAAPQAAAPQAATPKADGAMPWWKRRKRVKEEEAEMAAAPASLSATGLDEALAHLDAPFSQTLLAMIDERGLTDAQVYGRANLSRQYFSKLRSGKVNPSKRVVLSLAVALELPLDDTRMLLERAGHALTHASKFDVIVEWFITRGRYDVFEINEALFAFDQQLLGAS